MGGWVGEEGVFLSLSLLLTWVELVPDVGGNGAGQHGGLHDLARVGVAYGQLLGLCLLGGWVGG